MKKYENTSISMKPKKRRSGLFKLLAKYRREKKIQDMIEKHSSHGYETRSDPCV